MSYSSCIIANKFISLSIFDNKIITNMNIHKLIFLVYRNNRFLIKDKPYIYENLLIFKPVYDALKIYGSEPIDDYIYDNKWNSFIGKLYGNKIKKGNIINLTLMNYEANLIKNIWNKYKDYNIYELYNIIQEELKEYINEI